ncbi:MAG: CPBP family intramembrane metalloprotease [Clostridiales bacterium]|nr:CPBP family intramembrane metalloprotease [Clostridiales bacterium]
MENETIGLSPKKTYIIIGVALIVQLLITTLISWAIFLPLNDPAKFQDFMIRFGPSFAFGLTYIPKLIGVVAFWLIVRKIPVFKGKAPGLGFKNIFQIFLITYAVAVTFNVIGANISAFSPAGKSVELDQISSFVSTGNIVAILIPVLFAPVLEELVFRKMILGRTKGFGETTAIVFSSLCFGLFHQNLTQFMFAFVLGLFLGYVYCKTGKVIVTIIMHMLINGFSSVIMFIMPMFGKTVTPAFILTVVLLVITSMAMIISGIILFIKWLRNRRFTPDNSMAICIPKRDVLATVYVNPAVITYIAICIAAIVIAFMNIKLF